MTVLQVCAFGAEHPGNFIASLEALEFSLASKGIKTIYAFVERAADKDWCKKISERTAVYFLPEAKARILPKTYQIMRRIYAENQVDIVHTHFELYDIPATVTAPKNAKVFWHLHDALKQLYQNSGLSRRVLTHLQYTFISERTQLLSVSEEHGAFAMSLGCPAKQITYFPNGINTRRISRTPLQKSSNEFLMFGWDVFRKGVDLIIQAERIVQSEDCKIVIVGQDECSKYLNKHSSSKHVLFHPPVNNINTLFDRAKVFLHISRAEGLSYALLEAIYAGVPVICSDIPENSFAKEFRNIFYVPNEGIAEIAAQIDVFCRSERPVLEADIDYNRSIIDKKYSINAWCDRLVNLYLESIQ